ncbi:MAG TPA: hypothetical protein VEC60_09230, partial [Reyranella sp.]|nr:hypothetical protein [Reyranella sp.]
VDLIACSVAGNGTIGGGTLKDYGAQAFGMGWCRYYLRVPTVTTSVKKTIALTSGTGVTSYAGSAGAGLYAWGSQLERQPSGGTQNYNRVATPTMYKPTEAATANEVSTSLISVNGVRDVAIANAVLGPGADQGLHFEDWAGPVTASNITISDIGGECVNLHSTASVQINGLTCTNPGVGGVHAWYYDPAPPRISIGPGYIQNQDLSLKNIQVDAAGNPATQWGFAIGAAADPFRLQFDNPDPVGLPQGPLDAPNPAPAILWENNASQKLSVDDFTRVKLTVAQLGTCTVAKQGQRRRVSDANAPSWGAAVAGGGTVDTDVRCIGGSWVVGR